jgi:hypothetical protein
MAGPNEQGTPALPSAVSIATSRAVLRRSFVLALVIGAGLVLFNQRGAIFGAAAFSFLAVVLSFVTPFVVICISQALGVRAYVRGRQAWRPEMFWTTMGSHGIPRRALSVAPLVGVAVTAIMAGLAWIEVGDPLAVPATQVLQVFALPFAFGLVSQAAAYRRVAARA